MKKLCGGAVFSLYLSSCLVADALPTGEFVESGGARFREVGESRLDITCQDLTVIQWDTFSIDSHEHFKFHLKEGERVLNCVSGHTSGAQMSRILGKLESKGDIFLVNPAGIFIGPSALIDVGSLVASTLQIKTSDFISLKNLKDDGAFELSLSGDAPSKIVNLGKVHASVGSILLIAPEVNQKGTLKAPDGNVGLTSAYEALIELKKKSHPLIRARFQNREGMKGTKVGVTQEGIIEALSVEILAASHAHALAINQAGHVEAKSIHEEGGKVFLLADKGEISHRGSLKAPGGEIVVRGREIVFEEGSNLCVSSNVKPGHISIGDECTEKLSFKPSSRLAADALMRGNGGEIELYSRGCLKLNGDISLQGGFEGGDGGYLFAVFRGESEKFIIDGVIDGKAPNGQEGRFEVLLPSSLRIYDRASGRLKTLPKGELKRFSYLAGCRPINPFFIDRSSQSSKANTCMRKGIKDSSALKSPDFIVKKEDRPLALDLASGELSSSSISSLHRSSYTKQRIEGMFSQKKSVHPKKGSKKRGAKSPKVRAKRGDKPVKPSKQIRPKAESKSKPSKNKRSRQGK